MEITVNETIIQLHMVVVMLMLIIFHPSPHARETDVIHGNSDIDFNLSTSQTNDDLSTNGKTTNNTKENHVKRNEDNKNITSSKLRSVI